MQSKGLSRVFSNTTVQKHQFFGTQLSLWSNLNSERTVVKKKKKKLKNTTAATTLIHANTAAVLSTMTAQKKGKYKHTSFIALCFIVLCRHCIFHKLKVCGYPVSSRFIGTIFPIALAHLMSLGHILLILPIYQTLH